MGRRRRPAPVKRGIAKVVRETTRRLTVKSAKGAGPEARISVTPKSHASVLKLKRKTIGIATALALKKHGITSPEDRKFVYRVMQCYSDALVKEEREEADEMLRMLGVKLKGLGFSMEKGNAFFDYFSNTLKRLQIRSIEEVAERASRVK